MTLLEELFRNAGSPPIAEESPKELSHFGDSRVDEYYWLRDRESPKVIELLKKENEYAKRVTAPLKELEDSLFTEIKSRIKETDLSVPVKKGSYLYFSKTEEGKQYPIHLRSHVETKNEELLIDENKEANGSEFFALGGLAVSPDENQIAYLTDHDGSELYTLTVRNISEPTNIKVQLKECYYGIAWSLDSNVIFYTKTDSQMRPYQIWRLDLDSLQSELAFEEEDEGYYIGIGTTKDDRFIVIEAGSKTTTQSFVIDAAKPRQNPIPFTQRVKDLEYQIEHHGNSFLVVTNRDHQDFSLMIVDENIFDHTAWTPLLDAENGVRLLGIEVFSKFVAILERRLAITRLRVMNLENKDIFEIPTDEDVSTIYIGSNEEFASSVLRYEYTSMVTPRSVLEIDLETRKITLLKRSEVLGDFDSSHYSTFRVWATAQDGTKIPVSVVAKADLHPTESGHPTLIYGYGSYEHSIDPTFSSVRLSLLDRGMIFAFAHVRGGGELGRAWYKDGKLDKKLNTFTDFVDATRSLVELGWADPRRIAARGGSAGGMLMGAVTNLAPDLYNVVVAEVPFVDCLTTIMDPSLPLTTFEWEEWGNPIEDEAIYSLMKSYTPFENISAVRYPSILVTAGLNDPRVSYWEPAKWVQRLRKITLEPRVIMKCEMGAGHQGPSGRYDAWRDEAWVYSFILRALEVA